MYSINGDGSRRYTKILRDGVLLEGWKVCHFFVDVEGCCNADVDKICGTLDTIIIKGIYLIVGAGAFENTKVFVQDEMLRGVQSIEGLICEDEPPELTIHTLMLPNIVEIGEEECLKLG